MSLTPEQAGRIFDLARSYHASQGQQVITRTSAEFQKHQYELMGVKTAPDFTPVEYRATNPGHILVEWIGDSGPLGNELILAAKRAGILPPGVVEALKLIHERKINSRWDGATSRTVGFMDGFPRVITWGPRPGTYIQELTHAEADRLFSSPSGYEFRYFENGNVYEFRRDYITMAIPPNLQDRVRGISVRIGPEQRLIGVAEGNARIGYWK